MPVLPPRLLALAVRCGAALPTRMFRHNSTSALAHAALLTERLVPKCTLCGITLQTTKPALPGYFIKPAAVPAAPRVRATDLAYEQALKDLSDEDKALLFDGAAPEPTPPKPAKNRPQTAGHQCLRCREAHHRLKFDVAQFGHESVEQVMARVPAEAPLVYVVSATDFPLSLDAEVFRHRLPRTIDFVVTKADLFFATHSLACRYGLPFFQDYLHRAHGVRPERVRLVSGKTDWGTEQLLDTLRDLTMFIGAVNSGKLTLLQLLTLAAHERRARLPNARAEKRQQKEADAQLKSGRTYGALRQARRDTARFKSQHGPGVSHMPGFTRELVPVEVSPLVTLYDVPGFGSAAPLYELVAPAGVKQLSKGVPFHKAGTYKARYETAREGQVVTVGGLFFMPVPAGCMYRVRNLVNHPVHVFLGMAKALQTWREPLNQRAVDGLFLVNNTTRLRAFTVPPFDGSFDLVLRGLGFVNITATGRRPDPAAEQPLVVYLPEGIDATWREPIAKYTTRTLSGRDARGNVLRKENWARLSTTEVKRYSGKEPLVKALRQNEEGPLASQESPLASQESPLASQESQLTQPASLADLSGLAPTSEVASTAT